MEDKASSIWARVAVDAAQHARRRSGMSGVTNPSETSPGQAALQAQKRLAQAQFRGAKTGRYPPWSSMEFPSTVLTPIGIDLAHLIIVN